MLLVVVNIVFLVVLVLLVVLVAVLFSHFSPAPVIVFVLNVVVVLNDDYVYLYFPLIKISLGAERSTTDDDKSSVETVLLFNCDCDYC